MDQLSESSQLARFLNEQVRLQRPKFRAPCSRKMAGFDVLRTEILNFFELPTLIFYSILDNVEIIVNKICFLHRKVGVTERPRSLNPRKAIAMTICPIIVHIIT